VRTFCQGFSWLFLNLLVMLLLYGCAHRRPLSDVNLQSSDRCEVLVKRLDWNQPIDSLNVISWLYRGKCFKETIEQASIAKEKFSHKTFSVVGETIELFIPEGSVTDYVLESYERGYLTFLSANAYRQLEDTQAVTVELNKLYNEETALTYNFGQDPVNALLQAAMWDNHAHASFSSRPFWLWLSNQTTVDASIKRFSDKQILAMDQNAPKRRWQISEVGKFPEINWSLNFTNSEKGYFDFKPSRRFPESCSSDDVVFINTSSWFNKVSMRHSKSYHPFVNAKSWIRAPFGLAYGITTVAAGAGIMVTGCAVDAGIKGDGTLCKFSIQGGAATMSKSGDVVDFALQPDLRHWQEVPEGILLAAEGASLEDPCRKSLAGLVMIEIEKRGHPGEKGTPRKGDTRLTLIREKGTPD
jgi:hypothetical protein